jgi:hypothetical protein
MTGLDAIAAALGATGGWEDKHGSLWITPEALDVRQMASLMISSDARFITIAAMELPEGGGIRMDYHWDLGGVLATVVAKVEDNRMASIRDLCEAADWIEREIHEYLAVEFTGRECEPLFLRAGDELGIHLRKEDE